MSRCLPSDPARCTFLTSTLPPPPPAEPMLRDKFRIPLTVNPSSRDPRTLYKSTYFTGKSVLVCTSVRRTVKEFGIKTRTLLEKTGRISCQVVTVDGVWKGPQTNMPFFFPYARARLKTPCGLQSEHRESFIACLCLVILKVFTDIFQKRIKTPSLLYFVSFFTVSRRSCRGTV